jgi:hypothetical protein
LSMSCGKRRQRQNRRVRSKIKFKDSAARLCRPKRRTPRPAADNLEHHERRRGKEMGKKKKKESKPIFIPAETFDEAQEIITKAAQTGALHLLPYEDIIPESVCAKCTTVHEKVEAIQEYLSNRDVTDEEFFELIGGDPGYLRGNFAQEKIRQWQSEVNSTDENEAFQAQEQLKRIGKVLAHKENHKSLTRTFEIAEKRQNIYQELKESGITKMKSVSNVRLTLKEMFGRNILNDTRLATMIESRSLRNDNMIESRSLRNDKMADLITAILMNTRPSVVEKCRKKQVEKIKGHPIYRLRK